MLREDYRGFILEDEFVLKVVNIHNEDLKLRPKMWAEITDKTACIITAYIQGLLRSATK